MRAPRGDSGQTKAEILRAARKLFAEQGIGAASVRDVAKQAGVTHGLVHHYFGTKEQLVAEVIRNEVSVATDMLVSDPNATIADTLDVVRRALHYYLTERASTAMLLTRAELTGFEPEKLMPKDTPSSLEFLTERFTELQAEANAEALHVDPTLVSVYVAAAVFGLATMHRWIMSAAGLPPEDYERRLDEIVEIGVSFIAVVLGVKPGQQ